LAEKELEKNSISNADEILSIIDQAFQKKQLKKDGQEKKKKLL